MTFYILKGTSDSLKLRWCRGTLKFLASSSFNAYEDAGIGEYSCAICGVH